jgi:hypothetical protein
MKTIFSLPILSAILLFSMALSPADTHTKKTSVSVYVGNGTAWDGTLQMSGASYLDYDYGTDGYYFAGNVNTGSYTVTITCTAPGSHLYQFTGGFSQNSSTGSVTFNNVSVTGTSTATIY